MGIARLITVLIQRISKYTLQLLNLLFGSLPMPRRLYFAFGANMDPEFLKRRGIRPRSSFSACLENFQIAITSPCEYLGKGFASVEPLNNSSVYGIVHDISCLEGLILDLMEWVPFGFHRRANAIARMCDKTLCRHIFYYVTCLPKANLKASVAYRNALVTAAERFTFPIGYIEYLRSLPIADHFGLDHGFCLGNPARRRWREHELRACYRIHDHVREYLCRVLP